MPCWWMPASCANALRPTTALLGGGKTPVRCDSSWLVRKISRVLTLVRNETDRGRTRPAITTSSSEALPARSPMPFTVHSTWVAPASTAASEFATASPRSSWQWQLRATPRASGTRSRTARPSRQVDVAVVPARPRRECGAAPLPRHRAHAAEVPVGGRGDPRLDHVHSERVQLAREAELLLRGHRVARGLLSVAQRGVEDPHDVLFHGGSSWVKQKRREPLGSAALARLRRLLYRLFDRNLGARRRPLLSSNAQQQDEQEDDEHELIHDNVPISWSA